MKVAIHANVIDGRGLGKTPFDYGLGLDRYTPGSSLKDISRFTFMLGFEPE